MMKMLIPEICVSFARHAAVRAVSLRSAVFVSG